MKAMIVKRLKLRRYGFLPDFEIMSTAVTFEVDAPLSHVFFFFFDFFFFLRTGTKSASTPFLP